MREVRPVPPHCGGLDDDAVHERPHPRREVVYVRQAADLPAAERGHERLGGHRAAHLQGAPQDGVLRLGEPTGGGGGCWGGDGARESVLPARREGGPLGGELGGGGGWCRGREDRVGRGGGVLEARGGDEGGEAKAMAAAGGGVGGAEREVEAEMGVRESGGHWSGVVELYPLCLFGLGPWVHGTIFLKMNYCLQKF